MSWLIQHCVFPLEETNSSGVLDSTQNSESLKCFQIWLIGYSFDWILVCFSCSESTLVTTRCLIIERLMPKSNVDVILWHQTSRVLFWITNLYWLLTCLDQYPAMDHHTHIYCVLSSPTTSYCHSFYQSLNTIDNLLNADKLMTVVVTKLLLLFIHQNHPAPDYY